jgi:cation diffusion facilitator family transporter
VNTSRRQILFNLAIDLLLGVGKLAAGGVAHSSAVMAEGVHSFVDAVNIGLLFWGSSSSQRPADTDHPFGYGKEVYFWSLVVALLIFFVGVGFSVGEGILALQRTVEATGLGWQYAVLAVSFVFEGWSFISTRRAFSAEKGPRPTWKAVHETKNPTIVTLLFTDGISILGLLGAFGGLTLKHLLRNPLPDAIASWAIGLLLAGAAVLLVYESRGLLLGEGFSKAQAKQLQELVRNDPAVLQVQYPITMYLAPEDVLLNLEIEFKDHLSSDEIETTIERLEQRIQSQWPEIKRIYLEAKSFEHQPGRIEHPE